MLAGNEIVRAASGNKKEKKSYKLVMEMKWILIPPYLLTNFEIQKYYQNEPRFNGVFSRDNLPKKYRMGHM